MIYREYADLGSLDRPLVAEMVEREREWFGAAPFGEYAICTSPACRAVVSADEVFGLDLGRAMVPLPRLEAAVAGMPACPDCGAALEPMMPGERFRPYVREHVLPGTWGVLAFDDAGAVQGATLASLKRLREALEHLNYRQAYDLDAAQAAVAARLGLSFEQAGMRPVVYWNRIGVSARCRGPRTMASLMQRLFAMRPEFDDLPVLSDTFPSTGMYPLMRARGFEEVIGDSTGGVLLLAPAQRVFLSASGGSGPRRTDVKPTQGRRHDRNLPPLPPPATEEPMFRELGPQDMDEVAVRRIAAFFRETFAVAFRQYLFYPSRLEPIAPDAVFGPEACRAGLDLEQLDELNLAAHRSGSGEAPLFWHEPQATIDLMRRKLLGKGHAVLYYGPRGDLGAMTFAYPCTLREAFAWEEWENPVAYSGHVPPGRLRSFARFRDRLQETLSAHPAAFAGVPPLTEDSPVFVWNCVAVAPDHRRGGLALELMRRLAGGVEAQPGVLHLGEVMPGSYWNGMMKRAAAVEVPGALGEAPGQPLLLASPLVEHVRRLRLPAEEMMSFEAGCVKYATRPAAVAAAAQRPEAAHAAG